MPKVVSVEEVDASDGVDVFDIQVDVDASFLVGDAVLHNSHICRPRHMHRWLLNGTPIGHRLPFLGVPPIHWNCRSTLVPVLVPYDELPARLRSRVAAGRFPDRAPAEPDEPTTSRQPLTAAELRRLI